MKEEKKILLKTFEAFQKYCNDNSLQYYACSGTCLGAIRHNGIIPWDDDIDVLMPRDDYEKLLLNRNTLHGRGYEILNIGDHGYDAPFAKFCDANTTIWEEKRYPNIKGVYIDIFPLDAAGDLNVAEDLFRQKKIAESKYHEAIRAYSATYYLTLLRGFHFKTLLRQMFIPLYRNRYIRKNLHAFWALEEEIKKQKGNFLLYYGGYYGFNKEVFLKNYFGNGVSVPFENTKIVVPEKWDAYLKQLYGDYMTPPPPEKRVSHHNRYFMDLSKRWTMEDLLKLKLGSQKYIKYIYE